MKLSLKNFFIIAVILAGALEVFLIGNSFNPQPTLGAIESASCTVTTTTRVAVSGTTSRLVASTTASRAWVRLELVTDAQGIASSTINLNFNQDKPATIGNGITLSTSTPRIDFGINTDFPYQGAVEGINSTNAATTVRVTVCEY